MKTLTLTLTLVCRGASLSDLRLVTRWLNAIEPVHVAPGRSLLHVPDIGTLLVSDVGETLQLQLTCADIVAANFAKAWLNRRISALGTARWRRLAVTAEWLQAAPLSQPL